MHLSNDEHVVRFGGVSEKHVEMKVQSNGASNTKEHSSHANGSNGSTQTNGNASKVNEVQVTLPENLASDAVLDTVLAAWSILIQRYLGEVFHQFTWSAKVAGNKQTQCVPTYDLGLLDHKSAASLTSRIRGVRSKDITTEYDTILLNDGTKEEVRDPINFD
jgi:hypothetical protein